MTGPAALDAMARARVATMRLRKQRQTELLALAGCHGRAATLLEAKPEALAAEALQVRIHLVPVICLPFRTTCCRRGVLGSGVDKSGCACE